MLNETTVTKDPQYERILAELTKDRSKFAKKIVLSYEKYLQLIALLQNLISPLDAYLQIGIDDQTMEKYLRISPTLSQVVGVAQMYAKNLGKMQVVKILSGKPARKLKKLDRAGNPIEVDVAEVDPPYQFVQWFMEHVDPDFANKPIDVNLGISETMQRMVERYARTKPTHSE